MISVRVCVGTTQQIQLTNEDNLYVTIKHDSGKFSFNWPGCGERDREYTGGLTKLLTAALLVESKLPLIIRAVILGDDLPLEASFCQIKTETPVEDVALLRSVLKELHRAVIDYELAV